MPQSIVFYSSGFSSATPVAAALRELDVPHECVRLDLQRGDQRTPEHLARNPNGKVPTLVVDGTPMFEALAIMQWLGDRFGVERGLWPAADAPERLPALSWSTWAYVTYSAAIQRLNLATSEKAPAELRSEAYAAYARSQVEELLTVLDGYLGDRTYLLGDTYSLADLIAGCALAWGTYCGATTEAHPHVHAWLERVRARPAIQQEWG